MISLGLIGYPLSHSLSPRLHAAAFKALGIQGEYHLYPISPEETGALEEILGRLRSGAIQGLNVTIPHKQAVMSHLDELSPSAAAIGAVNTIIPMGGGLLGENTDAPGFLADLHRSFPHGFPSAYALVLGAGGAARAVVSALLSEGWKIALAVRPPDVQQASHLIADLAPGLVGVSIFQVLLRADELEPHLKSIGLIVNTTPLGMFPEVEGNPWPAGLTFPSSARVYDVVYNPRETAFLRQARQAGLSAASGIGMLVEQAALSFELWTGCRPPRAVMFSEVEVP
jgi:shikimate dehydrogenase